MGLKPVVRGHVESVRYRAYCFKMPLGAFKSNALCRLSSWYVNVALASNSLMLQFNIKLTLWGWYTPKGEHDTSSNAGKLLASAGSIHHDDKWIRDLRHYADLKGLGVTRNQIHLEKRRFLVLIHHNSPDSLHLIPGSMNHSTIPVYICVFGLLVMKVSCDILITTCLVTWWQSFVKEEWWQLES